MTHISADITEQQSKNTGVIMTVIAEHMAKCRYPLETKYVEYSLEHIRFIDLEPYYVEYLKEPGQHSCGRFLTWLAELFMSRGDFREWVGNEIERLTKH